MLLWDKKQGTVRMAAIKRERERAKVKAAGILGGKPVRSPVRRVKHTARRAREKVSSKRCRRTREETREERESAGREAGSS